MKFLAEQGLTGFIFVVQPNKFHALLLHRSHRSNFGVDGWLDKSCERVKYLIRLTRDVLLRDKMRQTNTAFPFRSEQRTENILRSTELSSK